MIRRGEFWWPEDDTWCHQVIHDELPDLDIAIGLTRGRKLAVQAGGNVGVWAAHLAGLFARVETAEPDEGNYACLRRNVPRTVRHRRAAFGERHKSVGFRAIPGNGGAGYLAGGGDIPVVTIDGLALDACDLLILDVEGYEPLALRGAEYTIREFRPVLMFEEKGLSEAYYHFPRGTAEQWVASLGLGYEVKARPRADVIMAC